VPCLHSHVNTATSIFNLGFDNWANPGVATNLLPAFTILSDSQNYQVISDRGGFLGEARGSKVMILDNVYHLLGTLDVNGVCKIYVNGILEGTASPDINMPVFLSTLNEFLGNAGRTLRNDLIIGTRFLDGAYRGSAATGEATIDNVRFYNFAFDAIQAALAAAQIAFSTGAQNATAYGTTEDELANNPEPGGGNFRFDTFWKPDGTRAFTCRGLSFEIAQNDVSPPWDVQTPWTNRVLTPNFANIRSIWWSPDGTRLSVCTRVASFSFNIKVFNQSATPWDLTVLGAETNKTLNSGFSGGPADHIWSADGLTCWVQYLGAAREILEYAASIAFDPTTLGPATVARFDMTPDSGTTVNTIAFSTDGTFMYAMSNQVLVSWDLSTPFDITTMANFQTGPSILAGSLGIPRGITVRPDNTDIFIEGDQNLRRVAWFRD
jgi:hypothetical protein